jgi:hypothetical protein
MHDGTRCGREPYDEQGLCICHSDKPDKDAAAFQHEIRAMLARKDYDFTGFVFPGGADFGNRAFDGPVWFRGATFQGAARFTNSTFQGEANFYAATFQGGAYFSFATFQGEANFYAATFQGAAQFSQATFQSVASFSVARFEGAALFAGYRDNWVFSREADADFRWARFHQSEKVLFQHAFLGRTRFLGADVRQVDFTAVEWARRSGGRFAVRDELTSEKEGEEKDYALIGNLYRQLKHNYEERRDPITAGDFHFGEMEMRRLEPCKGWLRATYRRYLSAIAFYRWISGYGEDYVRAGAWIVGMVLAFALAFTCIPAFALQPSPSSAASLSMEGFWSRFWYSVMCFLLRGDRPLQPVYPAGHYLSVAEGVVGPPLIALFILALNRRFKR